VPTAGSEVVFEPAIHTISMKAENGLDWRAVGAIAWLGGFTLILLSSAVAYLATIRRIRAGKIANTLLWSRFSGKPRITAGSRSHLSCSCRMR
jgi:hypothetical protein